MIVLYWSMYNKMHKLDESWTHVFTHVTITHIMISNILIPFLLHLFHPFSHSHPLWPPAICSLFLWVCFCFINLFCFADSTYKWNHVVFVCLWLISLSVIPSRSIQVVENSKISFFFCVWEIIPFIYIYIYTTVSLSIHLLIEA